MKNIKDIIIGIFAVIGFAAILTGFTNSTLETNKVNSNVFEMHKMEDNKIMIFNKYNGEINYKKVEGNYAQEYVNIDGTLTLNSGFFEVFTH